MKKATINSIFIYVISTVIIILVVYFGYRGITGMRDANQEATMEKFQMKINSDMEKLSIQYGSTASFKYHIGKDYHKICFVDLFLNKTQEQSRNSTLQNKYPLIWDSVKSGSNNNVFVRGKKTLSLDAGKIKVDCDPYIHCINKTGTSISFFAKGGGDSVIITCG